ncbi:hypothetical protein GWK47_017431 [Chionoecetes opilio]|uniref:Uncharacterized protein n=1 Tax=Chionoecetes opilio TaxID=41210 RepID=A0A8J5CH50_CHIOP|nr:hypothetical protein GWK47_017431 [Chionoecetes opilio]
MLGVWWGVGGLLLPLQPNKSRPTITATQSVGNSALPDAELVVRVLRAPPPPPPSLPEDTYTMAKIVECVPNFSEGRDKAHRSEDKRSADVQRFISPLVQSCCFILASREAARGPLAVREVCHDSFCHTLCPLCLFCRPYVRLNPSLEQSDARYKLLDWAF